MTKPKYGPTKPKFNPRISIEIEPILAQAKREFEAMLAEERETSKKKGGRRRKSIRVGPGSDLFD